MKTQKVKCTDCNFTRKPTETEKELSELTGLPAVTICEKCEAKRKAKSSGKGA